MSIAEAFILGLLQGLAEFLPISSSAHLSLAPFLFGWKADPGLAFDVALHLGTLVTLLWYFRADWAALVRAALDLASPRAVSGDAAPDALAPDGRPAAGHAQATPRRFVPRTPDHWRVVYLVVATIPAAVGGLLLEDLAETTFRSPVLTAVALMVMGVLLWAADRAAPQDRALGGMRARDALLIGLAQVAALVPGVSRSGSTMTAGRALRFDRTSAARFSFLMSMPITAAAVVLKVPDLLSATGVTLPLVVGIVTAALSSWFAIAVLLRYLTRNSFAVFAVYRLVLGAVVLGVLFARR